MSSHAATSSFSTAGYISRPLRTSQPNFGNPRLAGVLWATARDAVRNISLACSALNPLKNQTLSQHRIQRDGRPNELGYGGDVFWFNANARVLIQHPGSRIKHRFLLARVRRRFSNPGSPRSCRIATYLRGSVAPRGWVVVLSAVRYSRNWASSLREPSAFAVCSISLAL